MKINVCTFFFKASLCRLPLTQQTIQVSLLCLVKWYALALPETPAEGATETAGENRGKAKRAAGD